MNASRSRSGPIRRVERLVGRLPRAEAPPDRQLRGTTSAGSTRVRAAHASASWSGCIDEERRHVAAGSTILRHLSADAGARGARRTPGGRSSKGCSAAAGGVTGAGLPAPRATARRRSPALNDDAQQFIRLEQSPTPLADARRRSRGLSRASAPRWSPATRRDWRAGSRPAPRAGSPAARLAGLGAGDPPRGRLRQDRRQARWSRSGSRACALPA